MKRSVKYITVFCIMSVMAVYGNDADRSSAGDSDKKEQLTVGSNVKQVKVPTEFYKLLKLTDMKFTMPADFQSVEVDIEKCEDVNYCHALKHRTKKLEVRYVIIPYRPAVKTEKKVMVGSDLTYRISSSTIISNIAGDDSNILKTVEFKPEDVKDDFNADWGASTVMNTESKFGEGYKLVVVTSLYRSKKGEAYIIFLFDNYRDIMKEYNDAFYSLMYLE